MKKIAILVSNPCVHDSRVIKQAETLASEQYDVSVYCYGLGGREAEEVVNGVFYKRVSELDLSVRTLIALMTLAIKEKNIFLGLPIQSVLLIAFICLFISPLFFINLVIKTILKALRSTLLPNMKWFSPLGKVIRFVSRRLLVPALHSILFLAFYDRLKNDTYDVIHAHDLDTALTGAFFANKNKVSLIYDAHELETDRDDRANVLSRTFSMWHERVVTRNAAAVITVSEKIALRMQKIHKLSSVPACILNAPRTHSDYLESPTSLRKDLDLEETDFLSVYVGLVGFGRNLEVILESVQYLPSNHHVAFIGMASDEFLSHADDLIRKWGIQNNAHICSPVTQKILIPHISSANLGLIMSADICDSFKYAMPNKLFEMSFAGMPLLVSNLESIREYVEQNEIGKALEEDITPQNIAKSILEIEENYDAIKPDPNKVEILQSRYGWEIQQSKLLNIYESLV